MDLTQNYLANMYGAEAMETYEVQENYYTPQPGMHTYFPRCLDIYDAVEAALDMAQRTKALESIEFIEIRENRRD